jgi:hypothetical protein
VAPPTVGEAPVSSYTCDMTMADLGPERPGQASDTRQMSDVDRVIQPARVSGRVFWVALALIVMGVAVFFVVR